MVFPTKSTSDPRFQFYYSNYGFRSSTDFTLVVDILIKDSNLKPICYHELLISNDETAYDEAVAFQEKFVSDPELYRNITINY